MSGNKKEKNQLKHEFIIFIVWGGSGGSPEYSLFGFEKTISFCEKSYKDI